MKKAFIIQVLACLVALMLLFAGVGLLAGCGGGEAPAEPEGGGQAAKQKVKKSSSRKSGSSSMAKAAEESDAEFEEALERSASYSYDPTGKRNPFDVPDVPMSAQKCRQKPGTCYNLEQMYIDCMLFGSGMDIAHILLPSRNEITVRPGDELGINHGVVKFIGERDGKNIIVVEEIYVDPLKPEDIHIIEKVLAMVEGDRRRRR